jgi:hypothetical protein
MGMSTKPSKAGEGIEREGEEREESFASALLGTSGESEHLREVGNEKFPHRHGAALETLYGHLNAVLTQMLKTEKEVAKEKKNESLMHPLVFAALITGILTLSSAYFAHSWQEKGAQNERQAELLKTKLDFATTFGDGFPTMLAHLYRNTKTGLWLDYRDNGSWDAAKHTAEENSNFEKTRKTQLDLYMQSLKGLTDSKKPTAMLATLTAIFGAETSASGNVLWTTVRTIQDLRDKEDAETLEQKYASLEKLHESANTQYIDVMMKIGQELKH